MNRTDKIKEILSNRRNILTCDACSKTWVPFGAKFQDTCPHCLKIQGLSKEDSYFLSLYDDNDQVIDEL